MGGDFVKGRAIWLGFLILVLSTTCAFGQGIVTGSMSGTAVDPQKAVVTGAQVTATLVATGQNFKTTTNEVGYFSLRSIPIGTYTLTVDAPNFRKLQLAGVEVTTSNITDLGALALAIGTTAEAVTVEAAAPLIETTLAQGGSTFENKTIASLPIASAFDDLAFYTPGVSTVGSQGMSNTNGEAFAVNGQRGRNNNFQIDGQYNNDNSVAGPSLFLSNPDVIAEVRIITNDPDVTYGRNSGANINYVLKSGTNNYHGTAFEYYTGNFAQSLDNLSKNAALGFCLKGQDPAATRCTPTEGPPRYVENRWGGTLGGPILPNKIWFFAHYLQDSTKSAGSLANSGATITPTPEGLAMLNSFYPGNAGVNYLNNFGPYAYSQGNPRPMPNTQVNQTVSDGVTSHVVPFSKVERNFATPATDYETGGRVDIQMTPKDLLFGRYFFQQQLGIADFGTTAAGDWTTVHSRGQQIALDWTRTMSDRLVNQVRFNYLRIIVPFDGGTNPNCLVTSPHDCPTEVVFPSTFLSMGLPTNAPQARLVNNSQWQDNASWVRGRHTIKFGGEYDRQRSPNIGLFGSNGAYTFASFNTFLQNNISTLSLVNGPDTVNYKEQDSTLYVSDEWRFRGNLTLTFGVRWEYWQQAINLLHNLSVATQTGPSPFWNPALGLSRTTLPAVPNDTNNFGPSIGFAWTPRIFKSIFGENKTVIRGGYRVTYDPAYYNMFLNTWQSAPVVNAATLTAAGCTAPCLPMGATGSAVLAAHLSDIPTFASCTPAQLAAGCGDPGFRVQTPVSPNFHNPYVQTWTFGIQRELNSKVAVEARYVGSHTVGEFQTLIGNPSLAGLNAFIAAGGPNLIPAGVTPCASASTNGFANPGFANQQVDCLHRNVSVRANTAWSTYNSLQTELRVRQWHGVTSGVAYTFSKTMDNTSEVFNTTAGDMIAQAQNPFSPSVGERSLSGLDYPRILSIYMLYETPWFKDQHGLVGHLLGGWQFNTAYRYTSGQLWTPRSVRAAFGGDPFCDDTYARTLPSTFERCRSYLGNPSAPVDSVGQCTDQTLPDCGLVDFMTGLPTTASKVHWIYNDGTAALFFKTPYGMRRNPGVRGDQVNTINFSLLKTARISERMNLRLEAQVYNLFNTSYLGVPGTFIDNGNLSVHGSFGTTAFRDNGGNDFGAVTATGLGVRTMSVGAKIIF